MFYRVVVTRSQIQTQVFNVEASDKADLEETLQELDFGFIDSRFDEAEVDSIEYDVLSVEESKNQSAKYRTFADEDLQEMLNQV